MSVREEKQAGSRVAPAGRARTRLGTARPGIGAARRERTRRREDSRKLPGEPRTPAGAGTAQAQG